jgi:hypothetical protein
MTRSHYVFLKVFHSAKNEDKFNKGNVEIFRFEIDDKKFTVIFFKDFLSLIDEMKIIMDISVFFIQM